ncbi:MAG TPA: tetratricopeptide repeat protein, partial [Thermomicrobiales bacterium]|nr:tetratricopeptide repeat protein [Thermomicrobiales bacterium]
MEVVNLIQGAQEAMDRGDYRLTIAATKHALGEYPHCLSAHRMLGEAYLERADQKAAITHFERALTIDPLNVVARLGLGVASEETRDYQSAYAHYLHAWELNPALDQVRDELVRIRGLLNVEDKLHPTRAGLAGVHTRSGQFGRALGEWRAVLAAEPESRRARTSIAELLWRQGDDQAASVAAREALRGSPENARALALLAEIERRRGGPNAEEMGQRYVAADPAADVVAVLAPWRSDADFSFLRDQKLQVADFDFAANASRDTGPLGGRRVATASLAASQIAAPDLWDALVHDLAPEGVAPGMPGETASGQNTAPLVPFDPEPFQPDADAAAAMFGGGSFMDQTSVEETAPPVTADPFAVGAVTAPFNQAEVVQAEFAPSASEEASFADLMASLNEQTTNTSEGNVVPEMVAAGNGHVASASAVDVYGATVPFTHDGTGNPNPPSSSPATPSLPP